MTKEKKGHGKGSGSSSLGKAGVGPRLTKDPVVSAPKTTKTGPAAISPKKEATAGGAGSRPKRRKKKSGTGRPFYQRRAFWRWIVILALFGAVSLFVVVMYFAQDLPSINGLEAVHKKPGITMKAKDGLIIASYGDIYGEYIDYDRLPKPLIQAVLATEDRRFFAHHGVDFIGILRAMVVNLRAGHLVQGGSTITQQVAKNIFLTPERTIKRKIQEMLLAFWLEGRFTKKQLLAIYLNRVYLGAGNYGVDAAARRYFDKSATEMNLIESAQLAGLLKAPSKYSPIASPEKSKNRAHQVLINMVDADYISASQADEALALFVPPKLYRDDDPSGTRYFTDWLMDEIPNYVGNVEQDMVITTTLDPVLQKQAEDALVAVMDAQGKEKKASQAALLSMTPGGAIRALVGGRSYKESQFNRVVQAKRQPGSVFKLFVYLSALDAGMNPDTMVIDQPVEFRVGRTLWRPQNFDGKFRGEITLKEALTHSINTVAVQIAMWVGPQRVADMARRLGVANVKANPSIALGAADANLLELTGAYAHMANGGKGVKPYGIEAIHGQNGQLLYQHEEAQQWVVLKNSIVQKMNDMLMNVPVAGTGMRAYIGRPMAGKTGTSSDHKDAWFIGFTPQIVTGVWVGNDDNSVMNKVTGGNLPAMIWHDYMSVAMKDMPPLPIPHDVYAQDNGALPWQTQQEPQTLDEMFEQLDQDQSAPSPQPGPELNHGFWDKLFGTEQPSPPQPANTVPETPSPAVQPEPPVPPSPVPPSPEAAPPTASPIQAPASPPPPMPQHPNQGGIGGFLNRLEDSLPAGETEYSYPNSSGRERRLNR